MPVHRMAARRLSRSADQRRHLARRSCQAGVRGRRGPDQRHLGRRRSRPGRRRRRVRGGHGLLAHRRGRPADPAVPGELRDCPSAAWSTTSSRRSPRAAERAVGAGVARDAILIDPTHDFGKNTHHGLSLLRHVKDLVNTGWPVLMALSNKDFVGETLGVGLTERLEGTLAATALAAAGGCCHVPGARGWANTTRPRDGRVDPGGASTDADREGTGMSLTPELDSRRRSGADTAG